MIKISKISDLTDKDLIEINEYFDNAEFTKGVMSADYIGEETKNNMEMIKEYKQICHKKIRDAIKNDVDFLGYSSATILSNFIFSQYEKGMFYHTHNDSSDMNGVRSDWSCTVFLNDPSEYEGGELILYVGDAEVKVKLNAGEYVLYPTGYMHRVNEVLSGKRRVCVFWVESYISDYRIREVLSDLHEINMKYSDIINTNMDFVDKLSKVMFSLKRNFGTSSKSNK